MSKGKYRQIGIILHGTIDESGEEYGVTEEQYILIKEKCTDIIRAALGKEGSLYRVSATSLPWKS